MIRDAVWGNEMSHIKHRANVRVRTGDRAWLLIALLVALFVTTPPSRAASASQRSFATPEEASAALLQAVEAHNRGAVLAVLGSDAAQWISSGDATADRATSDRFAAAYNTKHAIAVAGDKATLTTGSDDYPFAFPLVKSGDRWRFDTAAGKEEMLARRIGANELDAIKVLEAIVDAQYDYASADRDADGVRTYARKFVSSKGKRDGLYWPTKAGEPPSPLGPFVAEATREGYGKKGSAPTPYHGYYYKLLDGQGKQAASGALDYVVHGRAIGGFAVVAYPAKYGNSGIMTFIVNQDGKVYQSDLGPQTEARASALRRYDPGPGWTLAGQR